MKKTYMASFKNKTVIRKTEATYNFAWCVEFIFDESVNLSIEDKNRSYIENYKKESFFATGFSKTLENAQKAVNSAQAHYFLKRFSSEIIPL